MSTPQVNYYITDHIPIFILIKNNKNIKESIENICLNYKKLLNLCKNINWDKIYSAKDPYKALMFLTDKIKKLIQDSTKKLKKKTKS